jgi:sialic acid synthase SpsE
MPTQKISSSTKGKTLAPKTQSRSFSIENKKVGVGQPVLIIAEAGVNHEGKIVLAHKLIDEAAKAGADMVKFQTFSADKIVIKKTEMCEYQKENLKSEQSQYDLLKGLEIDYDAHVDLMKHCKQKKIIFQSTSHSNQWSLDLLEHLGVTSHKIASGDLVNIPFLRKTAQTKKPLIISTGMAVMDEVKEGVETVHATGNDQFALLHCTSNYPCPFNEVNLKAMNSMQRFGYPIGYSDHTMGIMVSLLAVYTGATVIEKHFTLDRNMPGAKSPDHASSLIPEELALLVKGIRHLEKNKYPTFETAVQGLKKAGVDFSSEYEKLGLAKTVNLILGNGVKKPNPSETRIMKGIRKSIIAIKPIKKGEKFSKENIDILRPMGGLHPREWDNVLAKGKAAKDLKPQDFVTKDAVAY